MGKQERDAVDALALDVLGELSPDEAPLFAITSEAYWQEGGRLPRQGGGSGGLDFDAGAGIAITLAPIALAVANFALRMLMDVIRQLTTEATKHVTADLYARLRRRIGDAASDAPVRLPAAEYFLLREKIVAEAKRHLSEARAEELAEAVLVRIAEPKEARG